MMSTACFPNIIGSLVERTFNSLMSGGFLTHFSCLGSKRSHAHDSSGLAWWNFGASVSSGWHHHWYVRALRWVLDLLLPYYCVHEKDRASALRFGPPLLSLIWFPLRADTGLNWIEASDSLTVSASWSHGKGLAKVVERVYTFGALDEVRDCSRVLNRWVGGEMWSLFAMICVTGTAGERW